MVATLNAAFINSPIFLELKLLNFEQSSFLKFQLGPLTQALRNKNSFKRRIAITIEYAIPTKCVTIIEYARLVGHA